MKQSSPRVTTSSWGTIEVAGWGRFRDVKLFPGGAREWDWTETGTQHTPGIQTADVAELLEAGARVVVLSRGRSKRLKVPATTVDWLRTRGIEVHVLETTVAIETYDALAADERVGALIHSTC